MIIDGKVIAERIYSELEKEFAALPHKATLGIVMAGQDPVTASFVRIKERAAARLGVIVTKEELPEIISTEEALIAVENLVTYCDGVIVQLPLPAGVDTEKVLVAIPSSKDVDATNLNTPVSARVVHEPVALAVLALLERAHVEVRDKQVVVLGAGRLVGVPTARMLQERGAQVRVVTRNMGTIDDLKNADIVVSGIGSPGFIKPDMIKQGAVFIDAGTSESAGKVVGDADPACADKCSVFSPTPGGVGPVSVAMIFRNLLELTRKR